MTRNQMISEIKALTARHIRLHGGQGHHKNYLEKLSTQELERKLELARYLERENVAYEKLYNELGKAVVHNCSMGSAEPAQMVKFERLQHHSMMASTFWHQL